MEKTQVQLGIQYARYHHIRTVGGELKLTICALPWPVEPEKYIAYGCALVSDRETHFSYQKGRDIAFGRLEHVILTYDTGFPVEHVTDQIDRFGNCGRDWKLYLGLGKEGYAHCLYERVTGDKPILNDGILGMDRFFLRYGIQPIDRFIEGLKAVRRGVLNGGLGF